jgi:hypothetical protein
MAQASGKNGLIASISPKETRIKVDGLAKSVRLSNVQRLREKSAKGAGVKNFMPLEELATSPGYLAGALGAARNGCLSEIGYFLGVHQS